MFENNMESALWLLAGMFLLMFAVAWNIEVTAGREMGYSKETIAQVEELIERTSMNTECDWVSKIAGHC